MPTKRKPTRDARTSAAQAAALPLVLTPGRVPILSWATELDDAALRQATNLSARQPRRRRVGHRRGAVAVVRPTKRLTPLGVVTG